MCVLRQKRTLLFKQSLVRFGDTYRESELGDQLPHNDWVDSTARCVACGGQSDSQPAALVKVCIDQGDGWRKVDAGAEAAEDALR